MNLKANSYMYRKASGVFWIGEIPAHWDCGVLRHFAAMRTGHTPDRREQAYWQDCNIPWFTLADVWQLRDDERTYLGETKECISSLGLENSAAELLPAGTVILSRTASVGFSGIMPRPMATTQDFWNWIPGPRLTSRYLLYLFRAMRPEFERVAFGTTHLTIYETDAAQLRVCIPPIAEQDAIADYLDREASRIQALIAAKRRVFELLAEKRKAIVATAVTRGLDPKVKLRDSGVPWLGEIPAHWSVTRLKFHLNGITQGWSPQCEALPAGPDEWGVLKAGCVNGDTFNAEENKRLPDHETPLPQIEVHPRDVVMSRANTTELVGSAAIAPADVRARLLLSDKLYRLEVRADELMSEFLVYFLRTPPGRFDFERAASGASNSMQNISQDVVRNLWLPVPPMNEQHAIVEHIARETAKLDAVRAATERTIALLKERRTALIAAAVTGHLNMGAAE